MNWLQLVVAMLELPARPGEGKLWRRLAQLQLVHSLAGLLVGFTCVVGGIGLFFHGVAGSSSWVGRFIGLESRLSDAAPGTILFVVGLIIIWVTRFEVRVEGRAGWLAGVIRSVVAAFRRKRRRPQGHPHHRA